MSGPELLVGCKRSPFSKAAPSERLCWLLSSAGASNALGAVSFDGSDRVEQGIVPDGLQAVTTALAQDAFLGGLHAALFVAGSIAVVVVILAAFFVRSSTPAPDGEQVVKDAAIALSGSTALVASS